MIGRVMRTSSDVLADKPDDMFDRDVEWMELAAFVADQRPGATLGIVSGRRRQGKTFLLRALCEATGGFYFAADEATDSDSLHQIGAARAYSAQWTAVTGSPGPDRETRRSPRWSGAR